MFALRGEVAVEHVCHSLSLVYKSDHILPWNLWEIMIIIFVLLSSQMSVIIMSIMIVFNWYSWSIHWLPCNKIKHFQKNHLIPWVIIHLFAWPPNLISWLHIYHKLIVQNNFTGVSWIGFNIVDKRSTTCN